MSKSKQRVNINKDLSATSRKLRKFETCNSGGVDNKGHIEVMATQQKVIRKILKYQMSRNLLCNIGIGSK